MDSAEVRLLVAHSNMIYETAADLGPAGVQAAHSTLIELAKAVARRRVDDTEPQLASALAQAAKDLADNHLTDPELSGAMLARELNVSARSLQRAFAAAGESVTAYIRQRRLEEPRLALTTPSGRIERLGTRRPLAVRGQQPLHPRLQEALRPDADRLRPLDHCGAELTRTARPPWPVTCNQPMLVQREESAALRSTARMTYWTCRPSANDGRGPFPPSATDVTKSWTWWTNACS